MHDILRVTWTVAPLDPPLVWRNCPTCRTSMPFACTGDFRTNAQKKRIDIWLIYRCRACDARWNLPLFERIAVGDLPAGEFEAIAHNHPEAAACYAFDLNRLARHSHRIEASPGVRIRKHRSNGLIGASVLEIVLALLRPVHLRLDRVVAGELGVARSRLQTWLAQDTLRLEPRGTALRTHLADGQRIVIDLSAMEPEACAAMVVRASG